MANETGSGFLRSVFARGLTPEGEAPAPVSVPRVNLPGLPAEDWADRDEALRSFPLPEGAADAVLNRQQLATAMGVSENTITKWRQAGMPCVAEGNSGREWEFQLSECYAWRMLRDRTQQRRREEGDKAAAQMALQFLNNPDDEADGRMSAREIGEYAQAEISRLKAAQLRGDLIPTERVRDTFERAIVGFRNAMITLPDYAELEFGLGPEDVDKLQRRIDTMLDDLERRLAETVAPEGEVHRLASRQ